MNNNSPFKLETYEANQDIFKEGDEAAAVYVLRKGAVKIFTGTLGDNPQKIAEINAGGIFGEMALI